MNGITSKRVAVVLTVICCVAGVTLSAQSGGPGVRLEAGMAKEDVEGDLKAAAEIYTKIADDRSAPRDVRAKALMRLAGCDEKLGQQQARSIYERVVRDFADQPAAARARVRLESIKEAEHAAGPTTLTQRKSR